MSQVSRAFAAGIFSVAALVCIDPTVASAAAASRPLLDDLAPAQVPTLPPQAKARTAVLGTLDPGAMTAGAIEITFADGRTALARLQRLWRSDADAAQSWVGTFDDAPGSLLVLSRAKGAMTAMASLDGRTYELVPTAAGAHVLYEVDEARLPAGDAVATNLADTLQSLGTAAPGSAESSATTTATTSSTVHDVLILYTAAAATQWGPSTIESMVRSAVTAANQAYQNSLARVTLNVVGLKQTAVKEAGSMSTTVDALRNDSTVRSMRDNLGADMVVLVGQNSDLCGASQLWHTLSGTVSNWDAYAAVYSGCLSSQSLAHEVGHLQQLDHNRENSTGVHAYEYSYGYRRCVTGGFRDIMSYPCSTAVPRINYFSNPNLTYNGYPLGISYYSDPAHAADAARSLNDTAALVASYRPTKTSVTPPPATPTGVSAANGGNGTAVVTWTDASSNESRFDIRRAKWDATTGAWTWGYVVGSVGTNVTRFVDKSGKGTFRYYVRAANASGTSSYAGPAKVSVTGG